jgi:hypothetical protein
MFITFKTADFQPTLHQRRRRKLGFTVLSITFFVISSNSGYFKQCFEMQSMGKAVEEECFSDLTAINVDLEYPTATEFPMPFG